MNRGDELLCFYTNVAFENLGFCAFSELFRLRERGLSVKGKPIKNGKPLNNFVNKNLAMVTAVAPIPNNRKTNCENVGFCSHQFVRGDKA